MVLQRIIIAHYYSVVNIIIELVPNSVIKKHKILGLFLFYKLFHYSRYEEEKRSYVKNSNIVGTQIVYVLSDLNQLYPTYQTFR